MLLMAPLEKREMRAVLFHVHKYWIIIIIICGGKKNKMKFLQPWIRATI